MTVAWIVAVGIALAAPGAAAAAPCPPLLAGAGGDADACACAPPALPELRAAARRHAGLDEMPRWRRRARLAAALPWLTLRTARTQAWDDEVYAATPAEIGNRVVVEARLSWRLDRLLYDPAEPRLAGVERDTARARAALDAEVTALSFAWRRARIALAEAGEVDEAVDPARALDVEEAWAHLDARTGGWMSRHGACP